MPRTTAYRPTILAVVLVLSGCTTNGGPEAAPTPSASASIVAASPAASPTAAPAPSPTRDAEEQAVIDAYLAYWDIYFRANVDPPEATPDDLARVAAGEALETVRSSTSTFRQTGRAFRRPEPSVVEHRVTVTSLTTDAAAVRDCYVDDAFVETLATGERVNEGEGTQLNTGELVREEGAWKVAAIRLEQSWEGVAGCALEQP